MDDKFIVIYDWMVSDLKLNGNRAVVYAVIYGYSKTNDWFQGSISYLCKRTGLSEKGVRKILRSLCADGLLRRRDRPHKGIKFVDYQAITTVQRTEGNKVPRPSVLWGSNPRYKVPTKINKENKKINNARARKWGDYSQRTDVDYDAIEKKLISGRVDPEDIETH